MELRLGSVMLLLSCSLQQSLVGILASVPQTNANKCKNKISSEGEPPKRIILRRIPARCSGWDKAWSWLSSKDCGTKYVLDYVSDYPSVDPEDCEEEVAKPTESGEFNLADEKYLAIAFGSATVALLVLIVIIVISVVRRGNNRCRMCSSGPAYSSANASEREHLDARNSGRNEYVDDELKLAEPMYEEIHDQSTAMKKLEFLDDPKPVHYQNMTEDEGDAKDDGKKINGVQRRPMTPSAPYEEELHETTQKCVPNDYTAFSDIPLKSAVNVSESLHASENNDNIAASKCIGDTKNDSVDKGEVNECKESEMLTDNVKYGDVSQNSGSCNIKEKCGTAESEDTCGLIKLEDNCGAISSEDKLSQRASNSYEKLHTRTSSGEYDSLVMNDLTAPTPRLQEQNGEHGVDSTGATVLNSDRTSIEDINNGGVSTPVPVKLASSPTGEERSLDDIHVQKGGSENISITKQENGNHDVPDKHSEVCV